MSEWTEEKCTKAVAAVWNAAAKGLLIDEQTAEDANGYRYGNDALFPTKGRCGCAIGHIGLALRSEVPVENQESPEQVCEAAGMSRKTRFAIECLNDEVLGGISSFFGRWFRGLWVAHGVAKILKGIPTEEGSRAAA